MLCLLKESIGLGKIGLANEPMSYGDHTLPEFAQFLQNLLCQGSDFFWTFILFNYEIYLPLVIFGAVKDIVKSAINTTALQIITVIVVPRAIGYCI